MSYNWSKHTKLDSTGRRRTVFTSAFKNAKYNLKYWKTLVLTQKDVANLPGIAFEHYGTVSAFHIIMSYNGLTDPLTDIFTGQEIRLFTPGSLVALVSEQNKQPKKTRRI